MRINLHTHHPTLKHDTLEIESVYFGQKQVPSASFRSIGLHPWYLEGVDLDAACQWLKAEALKPATCAIGEAGLDKVCNTPWELQLLAFQHCVEVSELVGKPVIIHCVRAFSEIIGLKNKWNPSQAWIIHGFDKNLPTAARLLQAGCCLSFGVALFRANSHASESLLATPDDRLFLETDAAEIEIEAIYERAGSIRGITQPALEGLMESNLHRVLKIQV